MSQETRVVRFASNRFTVSSVRAFRQAMVRWGLIVHEHGQEGSEVVVSLSNGPEWYNRIARRRSRMKLVARIRKYLSSQKSVVLTHVEIDLDVPTNPARFDQVVFDRREFAKPDFVNDRRLAYRRDWYLQ